MFEGIAWIDSTDIISDSDTDNVCYDLNNLNVDSVKQKKQISQQCKVSSSFCYYYIFIDGTNPIHLTKQEINRVNIFPQT